MTEDEARNWFEERFGIERTGKVATFLEMVVDENSRQNLVSPASVDQIWKRHALDSAQLLFHVEQSQDPWLDIGTGGGFPGMVIALLTDRPITMVEPRRKRATFLSDCVRDLYLRHASVEARKVENITGQFAVVTARAVASVEALLTAAEHCTMPTTRWILPRGFVEPHYLAALRRDQRRVFHVEQSLTDPQSSILIVTQKGGHTR